MGDEQEIRYVVMGVEHISNLPATDGARVTAAADTHVDSLHAICARKPAAVTLEEGLGAVAVGEAGPRSIAEGRWVVIAELVGAGGA